MGYPAHAQSTRKIMPAKFPGTCSSCGCRFNVGEQIEFTAYPSGTKTVKHATAGQCAAAKQQRLEREKTNPTLDLKPIVQFLQSAQDRGLKAPKLRVLDLDGKTELRLGLTRSGHAPGSLSIVLEQVGYIGSIRPAGQMVGAISTDRARQELLLRVAQDPAKAAKTYAAVMCRCSFCGKALEDAGSVEVGYGPVCAKHWGLPHTALGTSVLSPVPQSA